jgi:hypothetical protein
MRNNAHTNAAGLQKGKVFNPNELNKFFLVPMITNKYTNEHI